MVFFFLYKIRIYVEAAWTESIRFLPTRRLEGLRFDFLLDPILVYLNVSKDQNKV